MTASDYHMLTQYTAKYGSLSGVRRVEAGLALVSASVYNAAGAKKQNGRHFEASDFLPSDEPMMDDTPENMAALLRVQ